MATKKELVDKLSKKVDYLPKEDLLEATDLIFNYLTEELVKENRIEIRGIGSFSIRKRKTANSEQSYNSVYFRMSQIISDKLSK